MDLKTNMIFAWLLLGMSLILSTNTNAQTLGCFDCSAYQSRIAAVDVFKSSQKYEDLIEVIDFKNDTVHSFRIEYDAESRQTFVMSASPTQQAKNVANNLTSQYRQLQSKVDQVNHLSNLADSAFDVITNNQHAVVANDYMRQADLLTQLGVYTGVVLSSVGKVIVNVNVVVDIAFVDGSKIRLKVTGINSAHQVEFIIIGATDADGNPIPLTLTSVNGTFIFNSKDNFEKFVSYLGVRYGISISDWQSIWDFNSNQPRTKVTISDCHAGKCVQPN